MFYEPLEESPEDHGICNVRDLEFIKAENVGVSGKITRDGDGWVTAIAAADAGAASPTDETHGEFGSMDAFMYVDHEGVKVDATLASDGRGKGVEEEVHEHGLAGANVTVEIESFGCMWWCRFWFWWGTGEEAGEERGCGEGCRGGNGRGCVSEELCVEGLEMLNDATLVWVCTERARRDERVVALQGQVRCRRTSGGGGGGRGRGRNGGLCRDANTDELCVVSRCVLECAEDSPRPHRRRRRRRR